MKYTVIGGQGFIGSNIVELLKKQGHDVWVPEKNSKDVLVKPLGIVIYAAGHGDCNNNPLKVFHSNLGYLVDIIERASFDKLVYLSSTRLYLGQSESGEASNLSINSNDSRRLFNLTKLVSEELILKSEKNCVIVRPSNVYGLALDSPLFLPSIIRNAIQTGRVDMYISPNYAKDYISVYDVAEMTIKIASDFNKNNQVFNLASGINTEAKDIAKILIQETGCEVVWHYNDVDEFFPRINCTLIQEHFRFKPANVLDDMVNMIFKYKKILDDI